MKVCYINLDFASDRRDYLEDNFRQHNALGWRIERFAAIDTSRFDESPLSFSALRDGQIGCFLSHLAVLNGHARAREDLMIVEDDVRFGPNSQAAIEAAIQKVPRDKWDILFSDLYVTSLGRIMGLYEMRRRLEGGLRLLDLADLSRDGTAFPFAGSSAYIVNGERIEEIAARLTPHATVSLPYDLYLGRLIAAKTISAFLIFPFATTLSRYADASQIQPGDSATRDALWNAFRRLMWVDGDPAEVARALDAMYAGLPRDARAEVMARIVAGLLSQ